MGDRSEGGTVDDGWTELLEDGGPVRVPSGAKSTTATDAPTREGDESGEKQDDAAEGTDEPGKEEDKAEESTADSPTWETPSDVEVPRAEAEVASSEGGSSWRFLGALVVMAALVGTWVMSIRDDDVSVPVADPEVRSLNVDRGELSVEDPADRTNRVAHASSEEAPVVEGDASSTQSPSAEPPEVKALPEAEEPPAEPRVVKEKSPDPVEPVPSGGDPRAVPPGTPPEVGKVFERLPVTPTDRPPVGKIGKSGIHIDRISVGTEYKSGRCGGQPDGFSISKRQRVNVCFRVVHQRQEEELRVLWQKDGGTVRRIKLKVPAAHAYRTRAFLVLREEYVGRWTVRIMSADGIELAAHAFSMVK